MFTYINYLYHNTMTTSPWNRSCLIGASGACHLSSGRATSQLNLFGAGGRLLTQHLINPNTYSPYTLTAGDGCHLNKPPRSSGHLIHTWRLNFPHHCVSIAPMNVDQFLQGFSIWALPVLSAITLHEAAHGYVAHRLGDQTAYMLGRVTLNPFKHIDPVGTLILPMLLLYLGGSIFGWAKPVPINGRNLKSYRRDLALIAAAGPLANLFMAFLWGGCAKLGFMLAQYGLSAEIIRWLLLSSVAGMQINLVLMIFNLLPLMPLDGGKIISVMLPGKIGYYFDQFEHVGFFLLVLLLISGLAAFLIIPPVQWLLDLIIRLYQLPF